MSNVDYGVAGYGAMMVDQVRMSAYEQALKAACRPGSVVMDLGTGTGIFALLACRLGARRVYAIDPSESVSVAAEIAQTNGCSDRITFIRGMSTDITLPEPVDVVVADVRGVLPLTGNSLVTMIDARRFLAPGGILIPAHDTIRGALAEKAKQYDELIAPWRRHALGFDVSAAERIVLNGWRKTHLSADELLTAPEDLATLDYTTLTDTDVSGSFTTVVRRSGTAHALTAWFETRLLGSIGFSNAPGQPPAIYGQAFFPLAAPVAVEPGDVVNAVVRATRVHDDYVWNWNTTIASSSGVSKGRFAQSTFYGVPLSAAALWKNDRNARPTLGVNGRIDRFILEHLDGRTPLGTLAQRVREQFPDRFPDEPSALARVTAITGRYEVETES